MRAQIAVISVILISGIIISLVGAAYFWGMPLVEKRSIVTQTQTAENFILRLSEAVIGIANTGAGTQSFDVPFGSVKIVPFNSTGDPYDMQTNAIIFEYIISQPMIFNISAVPVKTGSLEPVGTYGTDKARIITLESERSEEAWTVRYILHFRELKDSRSHRIALNEGHGVAQGAQRVTIGWDGRADNPEERPGAGYEGRDLVLTHIKAELT